MKRYLSLVLLFLLINSEVIAQFSCQTAILDQGDPFVINLPPVGTVAQQGPDYGCATILTRPIWGYLPSCDTTYFSNTFNVYTPFSLPQPLYHYSFVVWGPFHNKSSICNNLTASNIVICEDSIVVPGGSGTGSMFLPYFLANPQEYYIYMLATTDTGTTGYYETLNSVFQTGTRQYL